MSKEKTTIRKVNPGSAVKVPWIMFIIFIAYLLFAVLFSSFGLPETIAVAAVVIVTLLQAAMAALLFPAPLFVHGLVIILEIAFGLIFGRILFMLLMIGVYVLSIVLLYFWTREEKA
ncbi:MAG: hypothetical protein IJI65_04180 [Lachnospiraceae bacterium]|jgi:hypothetical protein|nr:hypothetical protein [Lachnospiraceae bacterium]MBQ6258110.1 hypothetical protein [Lachnospiraceae bacterium]